MSPTITIAELPDGWVDSRRATAQLYGHALRAGEGNTIEILTTYTGEWKPVTLPNKATAFAHELERNAVLAALQKAQKPESGATERSFTR